MKIASLFSGAGALDYGLEMAGHELVLLCESDPGARQVLKQGFPGVPVIDDVANITELPIETEVLVAGFPCIDVSKAGNRKGLDGYSTGLVRHIFRLLHKARDSHHPIPWLLFENVEAVLDRHGDDNTPPVIAYVVREIERLGYASWAYRIISSGGFGLPNRRRRVFISASFHGDARDLVLSQGYISCQGGCKFVFGEGKTCYGCHMKKLAAREEGDDDEIAFAVDLSNAMSAPGEDVVPTFTTCNDRMLLLLPDGRRGMLRIEDGERLQGLPINWTAPCYPVARYGMSAPRGVRIGNAAEVEAQTVRRWELLGNAVTVPIGRWLGERLANPHVYKYHEVSHAQERIDDLIQKSRMNDSDGTEFGRKSENGDSSGGKGRNIWSCLWTDELQQAVLFPYIVKDKTGEQQEDGNDDDALEVAARAVAEEVAQAQEAIAEEEKAESSALPAITSAAPPGGVGPIPHQTRENPRLNAEMFQTNLVDQIHGRGILQPPRHVQQDYDRESWPRCAWWVRGIGAFAVKDMNDSPVLTPYQPLGQFIEELGRPPTDEECSIYINRMKERGWHLTEGLSSRLGGADGPAKEITDVVRLPGLVDDSDMTGEIVWAYDQVTGKYWPGEVMDPLKPTPGRALPKDAEKYLTAEQRRASFPSTDGSYNHLEESAANRRVVVFFLPISRPGVMWTQSWAWFDPADLEPWEGDFLLQREKEAFKAMRDSKFPHKNKLKTAIEDAKGLVRLKSGRKSAETEKLRRTRAAAAAGAVDLKNRCGHCKTCTHTFPGNRRYDCLTQRMKAAALSGHAGAQVAICGPEAVGAKIEIWWDGNQVFFPCVVCWWDPVTTEHTVAYEDGELGLHRLWQHDERIRILNTPDEWPEDARIARDRLRAAHDRLMMSKQAKNSRKAAVAAAGVAAEEAAAKAGTLDDFEGKRDRIIQINREMLNMTGLPVASGGSLKTGSGGTLDSKAAVGAGGSNETAPPAPVEEEAAEVLIGGFETNAGGNGSDGNGPVTPLGDACPPPAAIAVVASAAAPAAAVGEALSPWSPGYFASLYGDEDDDDYEPRGRGRGRGRGGRKRGRGGRGGRGGGWSVLKKQKMLDQNQKLGLGGPFE